ncbi:MAG: hypothetical protein F4057_00815 [Acidobacteria bacterium]|nr:hypothetical protein [Acidobacteriota bacterium]
MFFDAGGLGLSTAEMAQRLATSGVRVSAVGGWIRAVTHLDVSEAGIDQAIAAVQDIALDITGQR